MPLRVFALTSPSILLFNDHDLSIIKTLLDAAKKAGLTAVIAMDQAVIAYARQIGMEVHISTQINITNIETVRFYSDVLPIRW